MRYLKIAALLLGAALFGWVIASCADPLESTENTDHIPASRIVVQRFVSDGTAVTVVRDDVTMTTCYALNNGNLSCLFTGNDTEGADDGGE